MLKELLQNRRYRRSLQGILIGFVLLVLLLGLILFHVARYNTKWQRVPFSEVASDEKVNFEVIPRSGSGAVWLKRPQVDFMSYGKQYTGMTIDMVITNTGKYTISDWLIKLDAPEKYYINNAWNGELEIHQLNNNVENVQTLNLLETKYTDVTLRAMDLEGDLLIDQNVGEYLIYHPAEFEQKLDPNQQIMIGFNIYLDGTPYFSPEFSSGEILYLPHIMLKDFVLMKVYLVLLIIWLTAFINIIISFYRSEQDRQKFEREKLAMDDIMGICAKCIAAKEAMIGTDTEDRAKIAVAIAKKLGVGEEDAHQLYYAALIHNCGNMTLPDSLLSKNPEDLSEDEHKQIVSHTIEGYYMLKDVESIPLAQDAAKYHHERWDGHGYPEGLRGDEIPKVARIVAAANTFEDIKNKFAVKKDISHVDFITAFTVMSGKALDPDICKVVIDMIKNNEISVE